MFFDWNVLRRDLLLLLRTFRTRQPGTQFGIFGFEATIFGNQLTHRVFHFLRLLFLAVSRVLRRFTILHFTTIQLLFLTQMVQPFTTTLWLRLCAVQVEELILNQVVNVFLVLC